jgi:uncharacterized protein (TIGR03643 family)
VARRRFDLDPVTIGEVIDMALSDHVSFTAIKDLFDLDENDVKKLMRAHLRPSRYRAWRRRVQSFGDRRETYKRDLVRPIDAQHGTIAEIDDPVSDVPPLRASNPSKRSLAKP